jgi:hypothetical protein
VLGGGQPFRVVGLCQGAEGKPANRAGTVWLEESGPVAIDGLLRSGLVTTATLQWVRTITAMETLPGVIARIRITARPNGPPGWMIFSARWHQLVLRRVCLRIVVPFLF